LPDSCQDVPVQNDYLTSLTKQQGFAFGILSMKMVSLVGYKSFRQMLKDLFHCLFQLTSNSTCKDCALTAGAP